MSQLLQHKPPTFQERVHRRHTGRVSLDIDMACLGIDVFGRSGGLRLVFLLLRYGILHFGRRCEGLLAEDIVNGFLGRNLWSVRRPDGRLAFLYIDDECAGHIELIDEGGAEKLCETLIVHPESVLAQIFEREQREEFRRGQEDLVREHHPPAGNFDECLDGMKRRFFRSEPRAYFREIPVAEQEYLRIASHGKMEIVFFQDAQGAVEFPEPGDIAVLDELGEREIDLVEGGFEAFDGAAPRVIEIFFLGDGSEEIHDVSRFLAPFGNIEYADQGAERALGDIFAAVLEDLDKWLDRASVGDEDFRHGFIQFERGLDFFWAFFL